jgi:hypothetical protein
MIHNSRMETLILINARGGRRAQLRRYVDWDGRPLAREGALCGRCPVCWNPEPAPRVRSFEHGGQVRGKGTSPWVLNSLTVG